MFVLFNLDSELLCFNDRDNKNYKNKKMKYLIEIIFKIGTNLEIYYIVNKEHSFHIS